VRYLQSVPGNHLADLLDLLDLESEEPRREALVALIEGLAEDRPSLVLERLEHAEAATATVLLHALAHAAPHLAVEAALRLKDRADPALQAAAISALAETPYTPALGRVVAGLLASPHPCVREKAVEYLAASNDPRAGDVIARHAESRAGHGLTNDEAESLGEALARQGGAGSLPLLTAWLHPHSLLGRVVESPSQRMLHRLAVAGLAKLPTAEAEQHLRAFLEESSGELHHLCLIALVQRRREQRARELQGA
jgi:nucleoid-associated protein YgaU